MGDPNASHPGTTLLDAVDLLPTPVASRTGRNEVALLPTPAASNPNDGEPVEQWEARKAKHADPTRGDDATRSGVPLSIAVRQLPTEPSEVVAVSDDEPAEIWWIDGDGAVWPTRWGKYGDAVDRWERAFGRSAPEPLADTNRLNPEFPEWMMGLPAGWVTEVLPRTAALRAIGNAVQPQTAAAAVRVLFERVTS